MNQKASAPTCGALYRLFEEQCQTLFFLQPGAIPHGDVRLADRAIGHMRGQAEKVFLGACRALMIRPASDWFTWACEAMLFTCNHYGMQLYIARDEGELWGCANFSVLQHVHATLKREEKDSPAWHLLRGRLCGIPASMLDQEYHQREGYGQRCEPESETTGKPS